MLDSNVKRHGPTGRLVFSVSEPILTFLRFATLSALVLASAFAPSAAGETLDVARTIWTSSDKENWTVSQPPDKDARLATAFKEGGRSVLAIDATPAEVKLSWVDRKARRDMVMHRAVSFTLNAELIEGDSVQLSLTVMDSSGAPLVFRPIALNPGTNTLTWHIPEDIAGNYPKEEAAISNLDGDLKFSEITVLKAAGRAAKVRFGEAKVVERKAPLDLIEVNLATGHPINLVLLPEAKEKPELILTNRSGWTVRANLDAIVSQWDGPERHIVQKVELDPAGTLRVAIPEDAKRQGIRWVDCRLSDGSQSRFKRLSYAVMNPNLSTAGRKQGFLFSICTHASWWMPDVREREFLALELIGTKIVRDGPGWEIAQASGPAQPYNWAPMDDYVATADKHHIEIQEILLGVPRWAAPEVASGWTWMAPERGWDAYGKFVFACVDRYKDKIRYWEAGNEPDIGFWRGTVDEYIRYLRITYEQAHRASPDARVMNGGFVWVGPSEGKQLNPDMADRVLKEAQDFFDLLAFHQHGVFNPFQKAIDIELPKRRALLQTPKPIYFNETAMHSCDIGEKGQAELLYKKLLLSWSRGAVGYTWYDLRNDGEDPRNPEHNFGLLTHDFHPKAAYLAYNTLTTLLGDTHHTGDVDLGKDTYACRFTSPGGRHVFAGWVEKANLPDRLVALQVGDGATAALVDLMGNQTVVPVQEGVALWPITRECHFLAVRGAATEPAVIGQLVTPPQALLATPGEPLELKANFANPLSGSATVNVRWELPACLTARDDVTAAVALAGHSGGTAALSVLPGRLPAGAPYDQPVVATLHWTVAATPWNGDLAVPVQLRLIVPEKALAQAEPLFRMATEDQVVNFFANDPANVANAWHGPDDLSAAVWLGIDAGDLVMRADVTDDIHCQINTNPLDMWKGDSIQFGYFIPGQAGYWEFGLALGPDDKPMTCLWKAPEGQTWVPDKLRLEIQPRQGGLVYTARIPISALGTTVEQLRKGIKFNLLVNDDDFGVRKGWIQLAPGLAIHKENPEHWPEVRFE